MDEEIGPPVAKPYLGHARPGRSVGGGPAAGRPSPVVPLPVVPLTIIPPSVAALPTMPPEVLAPRVVSQPVVLLDVLHNLLHFCVDTDIKDCATKLRGRQIAGVAMAEGVIVFRVLVGVVGLEVF